MPEFPPHRRSIYRQNSAKIRLHQHADGVTAERRGQFARRRADAAFEAEGDCAGARADRPFFDGTATRVFDGPEDFVTAHVPSANIVEVPIIGFADQWIDRLHSFVARQREHVINDCIGHARHVQRGRQHDRSFDLAEFIHLG